MGPSEREPISASHKYKVSNGYTDPEPRFPGTLGYPLPFRDFD